MRKINKYSVNKNYKKVLKMFNLNNLKHFIIEF